jgi:hypothetical protein
VIFLLFREDGDIIKIDHDYLVNESMEINIHLSLETGTDVYQSERHFPVGISAPWGMKGDFKMV